MNLRLLVALVLSAIFTATLLAQPPAAGGGSGPPLPEGVGKDVTQKVCGSTCHPPDIIMGKGRTRDQWTAVVNTMVSRGAKASTAELTEISEYLTSHFGPNMTVSAPPPPRRGGRSGGGAPGDSGRGPGPLGAGAADSHVVDDAGADRGKSVYIAECITCHGVKARGGNPNLPTNQQGPDLIRSLVVLHDRYGKEIGPFLAKGHPLQSGGSSLKVEEVSDLSHFLHQKVYNTLRSGPELQIQNVLTGDPKAGAAYFNGAGKCNTCHSPTGDFKGIGGRYDPPTIQSKFLFPRTVGFGRRGAAARTEKPVTVTVTPSNGQAVTGVLVALDDFNVSLRDSEGSYRSFKITESLKVVKHDPYAMHVALLDRYTDKNIHDIVAYLESLK
jgi:cytochrome c oxidase cbb3-type subunit 3